MTSQVYTAVAVDRSGMFGAAYDAAETSKRRKQITTQSKSPDKILTPTKRARLVETTKDIFNNFSLVAWACRRHLDYITSFSFQAKTGDPGLNTEIENLMRWYAKRLHCDVAGRHSLRKLVQLLELCAVIDGDCGLVKYESGHLQGIESDRIRNPHQGTDSQDGEYLHGVRLSKAGRANGYAVSRRVDSGWEYERTITAENFILHGYFQRFDQVRGVSPLAAAINTFRDVYEGLDHALAKAKVAQLFGLVFYSDSDEPVGSHTADSDGTFYDVDLGDGGPFKLELNPGDRAEFLEAKTPPQEFQNFEQIMMAIALKSLDIPFSFFDESFTNFYGSRAAFLHYNYSCHPKREQLRDVLDSITGWRLAKFVMDGTLKLPRGWTFADLRWEWIHRGVPWWDPSKEIKADIEAIEAGLTTRTDVVRERSGRDFYEVVDLLAEEEAYMRERGVNPQRATMRESTDVNDVDEERAKGETGSVSGK